MNQEYGAGFIKLRDITLKGLLPTQERNRENNPGGTPQEMCEGRLFPRVRQVQLVRTI